MKKILALSGGGIRGAATAAFLSLAIESTKPCYQVFDLIAGTSTGAILGAALSQGASATRVVGLYLKEGESIFRRRMIGGLWEAKYGRKGIEDALDGFFGVSSLISSKTRFMATCFDQQLSQPCHMKSWVDYTLLATQVCRRSSAAPTFFPAAEGRYLDGGIFANNPSVDAIVEAMRLWPGEEIYCLSVGTGTAPKRHTVVGDGGFLQCAPRLEDWLMGSPSENVEYISSTLLVDRFLHVDGWDESCSPAMDNADPKNIEALERMGISWTLRPETKAWIEKLL